MRTLARTGRLARDWSSWATFGLDGPPPVPNLPVVVANSHRVARYAHDKKDLAGHLRFLGQVDDAEKASALRSADVYCAPNTGGESFGIVLVEAMAAGTPVVATDLDAFRRVLEDGTAGRLVPVYDSEALAAALIDVLKDDEERENLVAAASKAVQRYDWSVVARQILQVYETVAGAGAKVQVAGST